MKLVIISHTEHYKTSDGDIVGWSPTVNEINHLAPYFTSITHVAMLHDTKAPKSVLNYSEPNVMFVALPALGGTSVWSKLKLILHLPKVISIVRKALKDADAFQLRTPTGIGVFLIPYLSWFSKKKGWFKYAGNWNQERPPFGYRLQRWMLKKQSRFVTINGRWDNQTKHCLTFENPCLTEADLNEGSETINQKQLTEKLNFCFVGRLETPKGVGRIINAFKTLSEVQKARVGHVHLVGDGKEKLEFESRAKDSGISFIFHGYMDREAVFEIYKTSQFFLMPTSASEGFPKVIAEAANFACIPVVSSVSAIAQYVEHEKNGFIIASVSSEGLKGELDKIFSLNNVDYKKLIDNNNYVEKFTFKHYTHRILTEILS